MMRFWKYVSNRHWIWCTGNTYKGGGNKLIEQRNCTENYAVMILRVYVHANMYTCILIKLWLVKLNNGSLN